MWILFILINSIYQYSDSIYYKNTIPLYIDIVNQKGDTKKSTENLLYNLTYLDPSKLLPQILQKLSLSKSYKKSILYLNGYGCPKWSFIELYKLEGMREIKKFKNNNLYAFIEYYYQNMLNFDFSHKHNLHKKSICLFNYFNENHLLIKPIYIQNHIKVLENYDELFKLKKILEMQIKFNSIIHESKKKSSIENKLNQLEEFTKKIQKIKQFKGYNDFNKLIDVRNFILLHNGFFDTEFKRKINIFYNLYMFLSKGKHKYLKLLKTDIEDIDFSFIADVKNKYSYSKLKDYAFYRLIRNTIIPPYNNCSFKVYKNLFKNKTQEFITYSLLGIISEGYGFAFKEYNNCKFEGDYYRYFKEILLIYLNN